LFLDPHDPEVIAEARRRASRSLAGGRKSPVYKMAMEWKVAFPLHPEYRTLPMVGTSRRCRRSRRPPNRPDGHERHDAGRESLRIPVRTWPTC
jgi:nitrate reductase beta subunit